jgi:hypothetical protein
MLPDGHTPGDKTLYLLAKLSKEMNAARASQLLTDEIDRRCHNLPVKMRWLEALILYRWLGSPLI